MPDGPTPLPDERPFGEWLTSEFPEVEQNPAGELAGRRNPRAEIEPIAGTMALFGEEVVESDRPSLVDFQNGELITTPERAALYLDRLRELQRDRLSKEIKAAEAFLLWHMDHRGEFTLHLEGGVMAVGDTEQAAERVEWDLEAFREGLRETGLPEDRIEQAIITTVSEKPNMTEVKRIAASSPERAAAIEAAQTRKPGTRRVQIKPDTTGKRKGVGSDG